MSWAAEICAYYGWTTEEWRDILARGPIGARHVRIVGKSGKARNLLVPSMELRAAQRWLNRRVFGQFEIDPAATAFARGCSPFGNAAQHGVIARPYVLRIDFANFFESIRSDRFFAVVERLGIASQWPDSYRLIIDRCCFATNRRLPQGYVTSPAIANIHMIEFDRAMRARLAELRPQLGAVRYTRYADDCVFSASRPGISRRLGGVVQRVLNDVGNLGVRVNHSKTRRMSTRSGSALVTGFRFREIDGKLMPALPRQLRDRVRGMLFRYRNGELDPAGKESLRGYLVFMRSADPHAYVRMALWASPEIHRLLGQLDENEPAEP